MNWIKELFADAQGLADDARIGAFLLIITYCGASVYAIYGGQKWDAQAFGLGAGFLATGVGALFGLRKDQ